MDLPFHDRHEAGRQLAGELQDLKGRDDLLVLGLPRGGVPVAYEIAMALDAPLDVFIERKLGVPGYEELAMGAIATGHVRVLNDEVVREARITPEVIDAVAATEGRELQRRDRLYRGSRPEPAVRDRTVILVDDGLATGSTMRAAVQAVRQLGPREVIVAVPVAAESTCRTFPDDVDRIVCMETLQPFYAIGLWYEDFAPTSDDDVRTLLVQAAQKTGIATLPPVGSGDGQTLPDKLARLIRPLTGARNDYDHLLELIGDARLVLIGEATHGTEEFYRERAVITRRLIEERGFDAVTAKADWPDAFRVNRYVRNRSDDGSSDEALAGFQRFPQWMWRNTVVRDFVDWLRVHNRDQPEDRQVAFYGLDLYSLNASMNAVVAYLDQVDPEAADRARQRYSCFDHYADDAQYYGHATSLGQQEPCEDEVVSQLMELRRRAGDLAMRDGHLAGDEFFSAEQNARLAKNAEAYYRSMFRGRVSWNLRDTHMAETLDAILDHLQTQRRRPAKVVVWAHNSHLGDARATQMGAEGEFNLGQLARERHPDETFLIGQTTYAGTVTAASDWDGPAERKRVRPGMTQSYEALFHDLGHDAFLLSPHDGPRPFTSSQLERGRSARDLPDRRSAASRAVDSVTDMNVDHGRATRKEVNIPADGALLAGTLSVPADATGIVLFAHGSGSSRFSPRNQQVAEALEGAGFGTLLFDLLTAQEATIDEVTRQFRFDIPRLGRRLVATTDWVRARREDLPLGYFGASTGAAAALIAAAARPDEVSAVVSRGGRPDLAGEALERVRASTLLIVGGEDHQVIDLNNAALDRMRCTRRLTLVPGATHLFEEPGALDEVTRLATEWFSRYLP